MVLADVEELLAVDDVADDAAPATALPAALAALPPEIPEAVQAARAMVPATASAPAAVRTRFIAFPPVVVTGAIRSLADERTLKVC